MGRKGENKSLFLYTALIFIVALLLIILSFFGDSHIKRNQPDIPPAATQATNGGGLTERAAQLSEDNRILLEKCKQLEQNQTNLEGENTLLKEQNAAAAFQNEISEKLFDIYGLLYKKKFDEAKAALAEINIDSLDLKQKEFYNILVTKAK